MRNRDESLEMRLHECRQHRTRLQKAENVLSDYIYMPLNGQIYRSLGDVEISFVDQMIFRFSKLQDSMGEKIFPAFLELGGENVKPMTFIDRLNRLEELEMLERIEWMELRKVRNEIAHEYSFNEEKVVDSINMVYRNIEKLIEIFNRFEKIILEKYGIGGDEFQR